MTSFRSTFNWRNTSECKKLTILTLFLLNILHRFATVITVTIDTKTQFITTNTFILFNVCLRSFKLYSCGRIHSLVFLNYSGKFRGSGGILTEPRSAPESLLAPVPGSEQWTLVSCGPGGWPDQCLSSLSTTLRQSMSQPCFYYHHKTKNQLE